MALVLFIAGIPFASSWAGEAANIWDNGAIYDPEDGEVHACALTLLDSDTLKLRGYVGVPLFGKTQTWTRVKEYRGPLRKGDFRLLRVANRT
ncbi:MAG: DUF2147 domain-containing protein [Proteobacteria bacterium]|nr:DUF2147 domain-containing protein [Pseudomonadota bacterium]